MKPEVAVKAVKLSEDFEADKLSVDFAREDMGELDLSIRIRHLFR